MKKEDLYEGIGGLEEDLLLRSEEMSANKNRFRWLKSLAKFAGAAACFLIVFLTYNHMGEKNEREDIGGIKAIPIVNEPSSGAVIENPIQIEDDTQSIVRSSQDVPQQEADMQSVADLARKKGVEENGSKEMEMVQMLSGYQSSMKPMQERLNLQNGEINFCPELQEAMSVYGDTAQYRVVVRIYKDGCILPSSGEEVNAEMERLGVAGYVVAYEIYNDGFSSNHLFTLHATRNQLLNFPINEQYGYYILFYDQEVGDSEGTEYVIPESNIQNGYYLPLEGDNELPSQDVPADSNGNVYREQTPYSDDILDLQSRISADMAEGKLPFVVSSSIMENPLRLEIRVTTQDEELINMVREYDPDSIYISIVQVSASIKE